MTDPLFLVEDIGSEVVVVLGSSRFNEILNVCK